MQQRGDIAVDRVQLRVTNTSAASTTITAASFSSPVLDGSADWDAGRPTTLAPGRTVDLPVFLPAIRCTDAPEAPEATLTADGARTTVPLSDDLDVLQRASATACDRAELASVVQVTAAEAVAAPDRSITLRLAVEPARNGEGTADLVALRGTVLLRFAAGSEAPLDVRVAAGDAPSVVEVAVVPQRCDAHAIAEDKVGTLFDLVARVDGREVVVPLERSKDVADALLVLTAQVCGLTPAG
ncbi:hypothetical protein SAMN04487848_1085 [Microbacterium sp. ru370.1]|nr:hypothetical protein SAMN04487848_1085 [Microbacterium sp. ru370.1]SIT82230.1 hypothetical protein SAMN05880579_1081 [Microbacterium sp. RU1D]